MLDVAAVPPGTVAWIAQRTGRFFFNLSGRVNRQDFWQARLVAAVSVTRTALTKEDCVFIEYRRTYEAHPIQHHYQVRHTPSGVKTECDFKLLDGSSLNLEVVQQIQCSKLAVEDDAGVARIMSEVLVEHLRKVEALAAQLRRSYS